MQRTQGSRIDLGELKSQVVKKIGVERSRKYFYYLSRFLSQKLSKSEFDKSCYHLLGRENLPLHNQLICSILKNASQARTPPPIHEAGHLSKSLVRTVKISTGRKDGPEQSGSLVPNHNQNVVPIWPNGILPMSPRKVRSVIRDRKIRDRPSSLEPNGKVESLLHQSISKEDNGGKVNIENGDLDHCDYQRSGQFEDEREGSFLQSMEKLRIPSEHQFETAVIRDVEEKQEEQARLNLSRCPLLAPLGIPFCPASVGGARKTAPISTDGDFVSCYDSGLLSNSDTLRKRMDSIAVAQGLEGVSKECANMLNNMLDVYLKRLIKSCVDLVGARSSNEQHRKHNVDNRQIQSKVINGMWRSNNSHVQSSNGPLDLMQNQHSVSLHDFRAAMELNPQQLGEDWPLLLEKICMRSFER